MIGTNKTSVKTLAAIIFILSFAAHFAYFGHPAETVFDEVHFGKFIAGYFTGQYFFDIHPPLGKLLISGMGYLAGFEPGFDFASIGQDFPNSSYLWLRLLPTLAGAFLPVVIFLLTLRLGLSRPASLAAGVLITLENALLVQSRFILLDSFLLLFGFLSLLFYFNFKPRRKVGTPTIRLFAMGTSGLEAAARNLFLSGFFASLALSVKWTGGAFLAILIILFITDLTKHRDEPRASAETSLSHGHEKEKLAGLGILSFFILPVIVYFSIFAVHFSLLDKSGPGDAFMTPEFRKTLEGSSDYNNSDIIPLSLTGKFLELNTQIYQSNSGLSATHPYSSKWHTWPFMARPIYYWNNPTGSPDTGLVPFTKYGGPTGSHHQSRIYLIGNPAIWWASAIAVIFLITVAAEKLIRKLVRKPDYAGNAWLPAFLLGSFLFNILPFAGIGRVLFLYHYFAAYIFAVLILVYLIDTLSGKIKIRTLAGLGLAAFIMFLYFAPLSYGLPLSPGAYENRVWFKSWR